MVLEGKLLLLLALPPILHPLKSRHYRKLSSYPVHGSNGGKDLVTAFLDMLWICIQRSHFAIGGTSTAYVQRHWRLKPFSQCALLEATDVGLLLLVGAQQNDQRNVVTTKYFWSSAIKEVGTFFQSMCSEDPKLLRGSAQMSTHFGDCVRLRQSWSVSST